ncbi:preprotein translocase subunit SecA [Enterobacteriaceae endosymbiont of Plateumaris consimilis]|uniref:preprotein translocase subunit SecA n=1 Tax=Enterobacteriaceae endosymbiont of Plateumaris consimilis TaxID=2675794 RepID=UPI001448A72B|nr:preprotein translocase subunit SecA [Enterobacteriaceae endosymbiont of Plateumaris consimilis]QJC28559.1 preprotein translocase subunit SecA [Enterobacteriaceae endosymbiont of Plateumaris consimilis]
MLKNFLSKIFGNHNDYVLRRIKKIVNIINSLEKSFENLTDLELKNKTLLFKKKIKENITLENILPEAFAVVREASKRLFGMRHFDVQLIGGIVLNNNCVAEMRTGEGKTLTATLPAYLNALTGNNVHIVTVNDYLAKRDAENNKILFEFLGLTVGVNLSGMSSSEKKISYLADITYGTNNEFGFDFLRDNMVFNYSDKVQRSLYYAIVDEVDSILIDEARTPLIISGPTEDNSELYIQINKIIPKLICQEKEDSDTFKGKGHYFIDEKSRQAYLTEKGLIYIEKILVEKKIIKKEESLYSNSNIIIMHHIIAGLRSHKLFKKNIDYIVKNNQIIIVDEHTGRIMQGRRWSDGLHQAIEAKENVKINNENQTLASITFQNYFRLYQKLSGMTGTANTEAFEFKEIYKLDTIVIPTNKPMIRKDLPDLVYITEKEKIKAIINDIKNKYYKGQPVLVGTISIEKSELISKKLTAIGIKHNILNAKLHSKEAEIISQAGKKNAVTIATNMAGRGTDIVLGGNIKFKLNDKLNKDQIKNINLSWLNEHNKVLLLGGLHVIGTERHESRRIDNQLRGRSGRQGDYGSSRFYLSLEDSLMRIFASNKISKIMYKFGMKENESIEHPWITKSIARAQEKVENYNFDIRKQLLEYDNIANDQRLAIYKQRNKLLQTVNISKIIKQFRIDVFKKIIDKYIKSDLFLEDEWNLVQLDNFFKKTFHIYLPIDKLLQTSKNNNTKVINKQNFLKKIIEFSEQEYNKKEIILGNDIIRNFEKNIMLKLLDSLWKEHLSAMDYLREGIHLRGYAQKDPKQEYKIESFHMFSSMLNLLKKEIITIISQISINLPEKDITKSSIQLKNFRIKNNEKIINSLNLSREDYRYFINKKKKYINIYSLNKIGRNDLCPCSSKKKYKFCHGKLNN